MFIMSLLVYSGMEVSISRTFIGGAFQVSSDFVILVLFFF